MASMQEKYILVAMDGSEHAEFAFNWYLENLHRPNHYVILLHCPEKHSFIQGPLGGTANAESIQAALGKEEKKEKAFLETLGKKLRDSEIGGKVKSVTGKAEEMIVKVAKDENVAFIVVGCRGKSKVRRTLMGSISDYVIHHSHVPVFVCRDGCIQSHHPASQACGTIWAFW